VSLAVGIATLVVMSLIAVRADRRLAPGAAYLPMNFAPDGTALRRAPRRVALWFMPGLAPDTLGAAIAGLSLLGGQAFYHWLIGRTA
jgi:hypothetical protein